jgi:hypothetical protein
MNEVSKDTGFNYRLASKDLLEYDHKTGVSTLITWKPKAILFMEGIFGRSAGCLRTNILPAYVTDEFVEADPAPIGLVDKKKEELKCEKHYKNRDKFI